MKNTDIENAMRWSASYDLDQEGWRPVIGRLYSVEDGLWSLEEYMDLHKLADRIADEGRAE